MKKILAFILVVCACASTMEAGYVLKEGKLVNARLVATLSAQEHYSMALEAYRNKDWMALIHQSNIVIENFEDSPFYQEAIFYLGAGYFHTKEYDLSNRELSNYLKNQSSLQHFREAIELKFQIAEHFKEGGKRHLMGWKSMPKWMPAQEEAMKLYEEVISALPTDDLAVRSLYGKGALLLEEEEFESAIEAYQTLIRKFPRHAIAPDAYVQIEKVYLTECQAKFKDSDFLDLAEINLKKFQEDFPNDERVLVAQKMFSDMLELYAHNFYEIGQFFERTKKPQAALIYYAKIVKNYPTTKSAESSQKRISVLRPRGHNVPTQNISKRDSIDLPSFSESHKAEIPFEKNP